MSLIEQQMFSSSVCHIQILASTIVIVDFAFRIGTLVLWTPFFIFSP